MQVYRLDKATGAKPHSASTPSRVESTALRSVRSIKRKYGEDHIEHGHALMALGDTLLLEHRLEQSATAYRNAAVIYAELGLGHEMLYAMALRSLAQVLSFKGEATEARELIKFSSELIRAYQ